MLHDFIYSKYLCPKYKENIYKNSKKLSKIPGGPGPPGSYMVLGPQDSSSSKITCHARFRETPHIC